MSKVKFNLKNVHIAPHTAVDSEGVITFDAPFALPGAVNLNLEAKGETSEFYADGIVYYESTSNLGYEGELEIANLNEDFITKILQETLDSKNVLMEMSDAEPKHFAMAFQIDGDEKETLFWYYDCSVARPTTTAKTKEENKEPQTDVLKIKTVPGHVTGLENSIVRVKTADKADGSVRTNWFTQVYVPTISPASASHK